MPEKEATPTVRLREKLAELRRATEYRHGLERDTPEYDNALVQEGRLIDQVRLLAADARRERDAG